MWLNSCSIHISGQIYTTVYCTVYIRTVGSFIVEILINGSLPGYIQVFKMKNIYL